MRQFKLSKAQAAAYLNRRNKAVKNGKPFHFIMKDIDFIIAFLGKFGKAPAPTATEVKHSLENRSAKELTKYLDSLNNRIIKEYNITYTLEKREFQGKMRDFVRKYY